MLRPQVTKTFLKATVALAVFSLFLELGPSKILNYLIFAAIYYLMVSLYALSKYRTSYELGDSAIVVSPWLRTRRSIELSSILEVSVAQGFLATRFHCGSVFLLLKEGKGRMTVMGGGTGDVLKDVHDPNGVAEEISSRLSPFGAT